MFHGIFIWYDVVTYIKYTNYVRKLCMRNNVRVKRIQASKFYMITNM
jgi:hypothetical protein